MKGDGEKKAFLEKKLGVYCKIELKPDYYELLGEPYDNIDDARMKKGQLQRMAVINGIPRNSEFARRHWGWLQGLKRDLSNAYTTLSDAGKRIEYDQKIRSPKGLWGKTVYEKLKTACAPLNNQMNDVVRKYLYDEGTHFNLKKEHVDEIIRDAIQNGALEDETHNPPEPYKGDEKFIFVSYKREDMSRIAQQLCDLANLGYNIWYDKGIPGGSEWDAMIEDNLRKCQLLLVFLSQEAAQSKWVRREIKYADIRNKPILVVMLGDVELTDGLDITLSAYQMISEEAKDLSVEINNALKYHRLL